jgi:hypothetical protein
MQARSRELERLDAFLNRTRVHKLHLLTSVLWLRGRKLSAVRRRTGAGFAETGEGPRERRGHELRRHSPGHP